MPTKRRKASKPRKSRNAAKPAIDPVIQELETIKKLLILQLVTDGVQAKDVGKALGLDKSEMSRLVATRGIKKVLG